MNETKFQHEDFTCDVDVFTKRDDMLVRFYDRSAEQEEEDIHDLVIVSPGYGYISLKFKGDEGLLSGFLDEAVFTKAAVLKAIDFVVRLSARSENAYIPHHVRLFKVTTCIEYNGEY